MFTPPALQLKTGRRRVSCPGWWGQNGGMQAGRGSSKKLESAASTVIRMEAKTAKRMETEKTKHRKQRTISDS